MLSVLKSIVLIFAGVAIIGIVLFMIVLLWALGLCLYDDNIKDI